MCQWAPPSLVYCKGSRHFHASSDDATDMNRAGPKAGVVVVLVAARSWSVSCESWCAVSDDADGGGSRNQHDDDPDERGSPLPSASMTARDY